MHGQEEKGCGSGEQVERITAGAAADLLLCVAPVASPLPSSRRRTRCLARKGRRQRTGTGREEPRRAGKVLESGPKPLSTPTDDTIKPDRRSDDRDSPATWPYVRSFWAEEQGQVSSFKDCSF